jgi:putative methyltransferase (TIGR04325 family)
MRLKEFAPPIAVKLLKRVLERPRRFDSFEAALKASDRGYQGDEITRVIFEKTVRFRDGLRKPLVLDSSALRVIMGLALAVRDNELNVIDFGGACGTHYFLARMAFEDRVRLRWHVVETPEMVRRARNLEDGNLRFFDNLPEAKADIGKADLVLSSYALEYVPQPYDTLESLIECGATNVLLTRIGLTTESSPIIFVQKSRLSSNGPGPMPLGIRDEVVHYPGTISQKDRFEAILSRDYSIGVQLIEGEGAYDALSPSIGMYSYFATRKVVA